MAADVRALLHNRLLVRSVMSTTIHTIGPAMLAAEVKQLMSERQVRHVLVCTPDRKLLGIISDRDLPVRPGATAADLMTRDAAVVAPDVTVAAAISVMLKRRISSLPVVEQDRVVGIVTMTDVAMTLQCALQSLDKVATELEEQGFAPRPVARSISSATGTSDAPRAP
jgi:CBS domain-containing protein